MQGEMGVVITSETAPSMLISFFSSTDNYAYLYNLIFRQIQTNYSYDVNPNFATPNGKHLSHIKSCSTAWWTFQNTTWL